jgi:hypothetical protein
MDGRRQNGRDWGVGYAADSLLFGVDALLEGQPRRRGDRSGAHADAPSNESIIGEIHMHGPFWTHLRPMLLGP